MDFLTRKIYTIDFGKNSLFMYHPSDTVDVCDDLINHRYDDVVQISRSKDKTIHEGLMDLIPTIEDNSVLIIENAHMRPRNGRSKAQPFTEDQILSIIEACEHSSIEIRFFPEKSTPTARAFSGINESSKSDEIDVMCLYRWADMNRDKLHTLKKAQKNFEISKVRQESYEYKRDTDVIMNNLRFMDYDLDACPMMAWLVEHLEDIHSALANQPYQFFFELADSGSIKRVGSKTIHKYSYNEDHSNTKKLSKTAQQIVDLLKEKGSPQDRDYIKNCVGCGNSPFNTLEMYGVVIHTPHEQKGELRGKLKALSTILATMMTEDGQIRRRPETGAIPGWSYCKKYIFRMSPYHYRGGVARSNLYWHTMKNQIIKFGKQEGFDFKRRVETNEKNKNSYPIRRGDFTPEEAAFFLKRRKNFCDSVRLVWQTMRDLINNDANLEYEVVEDLDSRRHSVQSEFKAPSKPQQQFQRNLF